MRAGRLRGAAAGIAGVIALLGATVAVAPAAWAKEGKHQEQHQRDHHEGADLTVSTQGHDSATCGSEDHACRTIGQAVKNASPGDEISVRKGTYAESVTIDKKLELTSDGAVIDAFGHINGIALTKDASWSEVRGFKIINAIGEGLVSTANTGVEISWNTIENNNQGGTVPPKQATTYPLCTPQGPIPGDCGEGLHLDGTVKARVEHNVVRDNVGGMLISDDAASSHDNWIAHNLVKDNKLDCGITMPSHSTHTVHDNVIAYNTSTGNGAAGVLIAASGPGDNDYNNTIKGNRIWGNGEGGVMMHAHAPGQTMDGNKVIDNWIGTNNSMGDMDSGDMQTTGIIVFSAVVPVNGTVIHDNTIVNNHFGIWLSKIVNSSQVDDNAFHNVVVPVQQ